MASRPCRCRSSLGLQSTSLHPQNARDSHRQLERERSVRRSFLLTSCRRVPPPFPTDTPASMACGSTSAQTAGASISAYRRSRRGDSGSWRGEGESPPGFRLDFRLFLRCRFLAGEMRRWWPLSGDVSSGGATFIRASPYLRFLAGVIPVLGGGYQWLWDMVDEFVYQFQPFCQYRAKMKNKTEQETALLRQHDQESTSLIRSYVVPEEIPDSVSPSYVPYMTI